MTNIIKIENVKNKIILIRNLPVLLDSDVAELYGIETREVNQAVKNNPEKFPEGYILNLDENEWNSLKSKILILKNQGRGEHVKYIPKVFTEKGLYMLATILKSKNAVETTIAIVETFTKIKELGRSISAIQNTKDESEQKSLIKKSSEIMADLLDDGLTVTGTETTMEFNFAMFKVKHTINRKKGDK